MKTATSLTRAWDNARFRTGAITLWLLVAAGGVAFGGAGDTTTPQEPNAKNRTIQVQEEEPATPPETSIDVPVTALPDTGPVTLPTAPQRHMEPSEGTPEEQTPDTTPDQGPVAPMGPEGGQGGGEGVIEVPNTTLESVTTTTIYSPPTTTTTIPVTTTIFEPPTTTLPQQPPTTCPPGNMCGEPTTTQGE